MNVDGQIHQSHEKIEAGLIKHFQGISQENNLDRVPFIKDLIKHIPKLVSIISTDL